jgi:hypothetical protein
MGVGLHGLNGLSPVIGHKLYTIYVLPRLLSGVETIILNQAELDALEGFHRKTLRQIQNLPPRTAIPAIYILTGALPIEAEIDKRKLSLLGAIARDNSTKLAKIAERQLVMKTQDSNSWFVATTQISYKYGLPSPLDTIADPPTKGAWKSTTHDAITYYWTTKLRADSVVKSTLQKLSSSNFNRTGPTPHSLWASVQLCPRDIQRAAYQAKMITGTYTLQSHRNIFSNQSINQSMADSSSSRSTHDGCHGSGVAPWL